MHAYSNFVSKDGDRFWFKTDQAVVGRHEIARFQFELYLLRKLTREEQRTAK